MFIKDTLVLSTEEAIQSWLGGRRLNVAFNPSAVM